MAMPKAESKTAKVMIQMRKLSQTVLILSCLLLCRLCNLLYYTRNTVYSSTECLSKALHVT